MKIKNITFETLDDYDGWFVFGDGTADPTSMESEALKLQSEALKKGFYCVCGIVGAGYGLYLVPKKGIKYVIEKFEVGSHAGAEPDSVFEEIASANAKNELIPYFADDAGLKAKFTEPVSSDLLEILEESLYSVDAMADEDDGSINDYITKNQGIHLWWD